MPSSELNDYIQLQKEIKRLKDDNTHLCSENKELLNRVKNIEYSEISENIKNINEERAESLTQEINVNTLLNKNFFFIRINILYIFYHN